VVTALALVLGVTSALGTTIYPDVPARVVFADNETEHASRIKETARNFFIQFSYA